MHFSENYVTNLIIQFYTKATKATKASKAAKITKDKAEQKEKPKGKVLR